MPDSDAAAMTLKILVPSQIFADRTGVTRIVVETHEGSYGLLPARLDCVAALSPGILTYESAADGVRYVAVDEGLLVKTGADVSISVRNAIEGTDLQSLQQTVDRQFITISDAEKAARLALVKLESGFARRLAEFSRRDGE